MNIHSIRLPFALLLSVAVVGVGATTAAAAPRTPVVVHQGLVIRQDIPSRGESEPDTTAEPDVAVSPKNADVAIAAAHDSRFADGGAVDISVAWTADGGRSWHHRPVQGLVTATGGTFARASDPVVAFDADGVAYLSTVLIYPKRCPSAVAVLRSTDGGQTWSKPVYAHQSATCDYSDDKNWLVVDNSPASPHFGRVYQFWTVFEAKDGTYLGAHQAVRWSDDQGRTWSGTSYVNGLGRETQNSQPMVLTDGSIVDTYYDFGVARGSEAPDAAPSDRTARQHLDAESAPINAFGTIRAATSRDGGATWSRSVEVANNAAGYADEVRCCLFAADIDPITHLMYTAWEGGVGSTDPVYESFSSDGTTWSSPIRVSQGDVPGVQRVNVDVVARAGKVFITYGTRTRPEQDGGFVQQQVSVSSDRGARFGAPTSIGPRSVLKYAAVAGARFPGDYIGAAIAPGRLYIVWARSSAPPPSSTSPYHQVIYGATLRP